MKTINRVIPKLTRKLKSQLNLHYTQGITPNRVTSDEAHLRGSAPEQHSSEGTSQQWRAAGDTVFDLIGPGIEPQVSGADSDVLNHYCNRPINKVFTINY